MDCLYRHLWYPHSVLLTVVNLTSAAQRSRNWTRGMSSAQTLLHLTPERGKVSFKETSENQLRSNTGGEQDPAQILALQTQQVEGCMGGSVRRVLLPTPSRPPTRPGPAVHRDELHGRGSDFWASYLNLSTLLGPTTRGCPFGPLPGLRRGCPHSIRPHTEVYTFIFKEIYDFLGRLGGSVG